MSPTSTKKPPFAVLCFGFVVCGVVTVLPGPLLPLLAARWGLRDVQSGAYFTALFAASTVAAILAPRRMRWSLPRGYALMTVGVFTLAVAARALTPTLANELALGAFAMIGLGIGLSVTATNLLVGNIEKEFRARRLSIVNLWWGIGAVACPWIVAAAEDAATLRLFLGLVGFASLAAFVLLLPLREEPRAATRNSGRPAELWVLMYFAVMLFLYVGVENTVGGWIATYANRFSGMTLVHSSLMVSVFWFTLLGGRGLGSQALKTWPERAVLVAGMGLALTAVVMLMSPQSEAAVVAAIAAAGLGLGPIFPVGVSRMLARLADHRRTGWVFATCAGGGAVLPWITGLVSTRTGSLRASFAVPVVALAAILLLVLLENVALPEPLSAEPANQQV
jgi:MFS transporter, FHS family, glucose/mannose:H+ symporter